MLHTRPSSLPTPQFCHFLFKTDNKQLPVENALFITGEFSLRTRLLALAARVVVSISALRAQKLQRAVL